MSDTKELASPTRSQFKPLVKVESIGELFKHPDFAKRIEKAIPKHMSGERMLRTIVNAVQRTPKLAEVSPTSMLGACITIAALGLEPNTPLQQCHLIPFEVNKWNPKTRKSEHIRTDVQVIIGYPGYIDLIYRSGLVQDIDCQIFYPDEVASGRFTYERGTNKHLNHKPLDKVRSPNEEPAGAYLYAKLANGGEFFEVLPLYKVHLARSRSQGFRTAMYAHDDAIANNRDPKRDKRYSEAPWIKDFEAMARKTALRAGQKWLPKSIELAAALSVDETPIDFGKLEDASMVFDGTYDVLDEGGEDAPADAPAEAPKAEPAKPATAKASAQKPTEARTAARAAARAVEPEPEPQPAGEPPPVENATYYPMLNTFGEEDDGPSGPTTSAIDFANRFAREWESLDGQTRTAFVEFNAESIALASANSDQAAQILSGVLQAKRQPEATLDLDVPRKKTPNGGWDLKSYLADAAAVLGQVSAADQLQAFLAVNASTIERLPPAARVNFDALVDHRTKEISPPAIEPPEDEVPMPEDEPPAAQQQTEDQWDRYAAGLRKDFAAVNGVSELQVLIGNAAVRVKLRELRAARPELAAELDDEYVKRLAELQP